MVAEKKVKAELEAVSKSLLELSQQTMRNEEELRSQRAALQAQRELHTAQQRHLKVGPGMSTPIPY